MPKKLSLCVIAGNVERYIDRFLNQFKPLADEIIVVGAIGHQEQDQTIARCRAAGCRVGWYGNASQMEEDMPQEWCWPHVDDFAAARNVACDMATGDWLMWADTDDTITAKSINAIRDLIEKIDGADIDSVQMRYVVPEDNVINWRERLWRKGSGRWVYPVHECIQFPPESKMVRFDGAEIVHGAGKRDPKSDERNLRILMSVPEDQRTVSQRFHVFQSLIALKRDDEAIIKAIEFCQLPDTGKPERYEAFFQLARLADNPHQKHAMLLQALATDPTRREAYGELGLSSLPHDPIASDGWTLAMIGLPMPLDPPWNLRRFYYGQLGVSLRAMALRANGRVKEADRMEVDLFSKRGSKISLLHATRGRPAKAWSQRKEWLRMADNADAIEHIFGIDKDDIDSLPLTIARHVIVPSGKGSVAAWNACAKASSGKVLVQMSDDFEPFHGWDTAILNALGNLTKSSVLAVSDGTRRDDLLCMAIMTRPRYKRQGHFFHPDFFSVYSDNWFSHCAFSDGCVIDARDSITFEHLHPAFGKAAMDNTYARGNSNVAYEQGKQTMERLMKS